MPPRRTSQFDPILGTDLADDDWIAVVDQSDTSEAPTGTDKRADIAELGVGVPRWDDLRVSLSTTFAPANAPSYDVFKGNLRAWAFGTGEQLFFDCQLPHDARVGVASAEVRPHLHWSPGNNTNTGTVQWYLEVEWANPVNEPDNEFTTLSGSPLSGAQAGVGVAYRHQIAPMGTIDASTFRPSTVLLCRLYRDATGDTFSGDAYALSMDFHYQRRNFGTRSEY